MQDYYLDICRYLDLEIPTSPKPTLYISDTLASQGANRLKNYGIEADATVIGLNPGASFGSSKCWPTEYFAELAEQLQDRFGGKLLLLVGPGEEAIADRIIQASNAEIINTAKDRIDLAHLKPLIMRCNLLITNDTGPRLYAGAFNVPHIVLMGPTNAIYTANNLQMSTVLQRQLPCVPCHKKTCPLGHHACMNEITPAMGIEAATNYLGHR